ncbi:unnamed protein product [Notodromas monacha]|uniref:Uncharacterized protein n=1 Tax=Notodromas monacha TaxID=399045 RepID=A0A7R9C2G1_9CRUS|nr:unnamed protein product [Notodromas monacha]CAG0924896.1 unnamed protein product [Notodromas monacha]
MTGDEMLYLYSRLRGMREPLISGHVKHLIQRLGLQNFWSKACGNYSGGNKRKLSTAMAMAADPSVLFLDEPTSGVDPVSRRRIWKALSAAIDNGQSIVLTSHSMEECEALCHRLGIMVNGRFRCLGPVSYLKQKFCQGYSILIKLDPKYGDDGESFQKLKEFIETSIPSSSLRDHHEGLIQYYISDPDTKWDLIFRTMELAKEKWSLFLEDYSVGETTLEQIFLTFARDQINDPSRYKVKSCWNCCKN